MPIRQQKQSTDGQQRLQRFLSEVLPAVYRAPRTEIVPWVEALWLRLGGPSVCLDDVDRDAAERALARLAALEQSTGLWQRQSVTQAMESLYAGENSDPVAQRVQLMTLHKSKGLEFGTVILPALGRQGRGDDRRLLDWYESTVDGRPSLLLAPIDAPGIHDSQRSAIGRLLRRFKSRADEAERLRLLYVACTRARRQLHLVATLACADDGMAKPPAHGSLLAPLWSGLAAEYARLRDPLPESMTGREVRQEMWVQQCIVNCNALPMWRTVTVYRRVAKILAESHGSYARLAWLKPLWMML